VVVVVDVDADEPRTRVQIPVGHMTHFAKDGPDLYRTAMSGASGRWLARSRANAIPSFVSVSVYDHDHDHDHDSLT
jgi:hypothetical protein